MGVMSARGAQLDNIAPLRKSTDRWARTRVRSGIFTRVTAMLVLLLLCVGDLSPVAGQSAAPRVAPAPVGTMSELMVRLIYPASDAIFYVSTRTPSTDAEWNTLQGQALLVAESANLLMMPAHLRDETRWLDDARLMRDAGQAAFTAAKAHDVNALEALNDALYQSCVTCHQHYRRNYGRGR